MRSLLKTGLRRISRAQPAASPRRARGPRAATVIAVAAQKGGVGKTTTSISVAASFARHHDKRVLLIDLDPQAHVHTALGAQIRPGGGALSDVLVGQGKEVLDVVTRTAIPNLDVTPLDQNLAGTENLLSTRIGKELLLREALDITRSFYDIIVIDCPPNLGNLTINGLVAADQVLIPADPSPLALSGVYALAEAIETVAMRLNPQLDVLGVLLTRVDGRNRRLNEAMMSELEEAFGDALLPVQIGINNGLVRAQHAGQDIFAFDPESRGAKHYQALTSHLVERLEG